MNPRIAMALATTVLIGCSGSSPTTSTVLAEPTTVQPETAASRTNPPTIPVVVTSTTTSTTTPRAAALECVSQMTTSERVALLLIGLGTQPVLATVDPTLVGSVVLVGQADAGIESTLNYLSGQRTPRLLTMVDEEGGRVQRLGSVIGELPSASSLGDTGTPAQTRAIMAEHGRKLAEHGFNVNLAPVVDVGGGPGIESRSYSDDPAVVIEHAQAAVEGLLEAGIVPVIKHFPGHGSASADSHQRLPLAPSLDELRRSDLLPFQALLATHGTDIAVMVGHLDVPGLTTEGRPTSLSPATIDGLLRTELGFDGVVMTDSLQMGAVSARWSEPEAAELAILAGADMAMVAVDVVGDAHARLSAAVASDALPEAELDRRAARVLQLMGHEPCGSAPHP